MELEETSTNAETIPKLNEYSEPLKDVCDPNTDVQPKNAPDLRAKRKRNLEMQVNIVKTGRRTKLKDVSDLIRRKTRSKTKENGGEKANVSIENISASPDVKPEVIQADTKSAEIMTGKTCCPNESRNAEDKIDHHSDENSDCTEVSTTDNENISDYRNVDKDKPRADVCYDTKELKCSQCKGCFPNQTEFDKHTCQGKTYICGACHCGFTRLCYLKRHKCSSSGKKSIKQPFVENLISSQNEGEENSKEVKDKRRNSNSRREDKKCLQCPLCPKKYSKQIYLDKHMFIHNDIMPWNCPECNAKFRSAAKFQAHCKTHGILKPFKCDKCNGYFSSAVVLRVHDRTHTNERPFSCNKCGKTFKQSSNLYDHLRKHNNDRPFICGTCGKAFNLKGDLTKHLQLHTGEKPYQCTFCPMAFPRASNLNRHLNTHTGTKPFSCPQCEKCFSRREKLRDHERIHSGERPYVCDICQKTFADSGNFSNHKRSHRNPVLKQQSRKKPTTTRIGCFTTEENMTNLKLPLINIDESHSMLSINAEPAMQPSTQERGTEFSDGHQQQILYLTFQNSVVIVDKPYGKMSADDNAEPLLFQLQSLTDSQSPDNVAQVESSNENRHSEPGIQSGTDSCINPDNLNVATVNAADNSGCLESGENRTESGNLVEKSIEMVVESNQVRSVSESQEVLCESNPATGYFIPGYEQSLEESFIAAGKDQGAGNHGNSNVDYKYLNLATSSDSYFTSGLTLTDLTGNDYYNSMCDSQPGYVFIPQEGSDVESSKVNGILLATPTKSNCEIKSKSAFICSQVLVTPEHQTVVKNNGRTSEESDEERAHYKPRVLKL